MIISLDYEVIDFPNLEGVTIEARALDVKSYQKILPLVKNVSSDDIEIKGIEILSDPAVLDLFKDILVKNTRRITGLEIKKDGELKDAEIGDLIKIGSMLPNLFMLMMSLVTMSNLTEQEEKKVEN